MAIVIYAVEILAYWLAIFNAYGPTYDQLERWETLCRARESELTRLQSTVGHLAERANQADIQNRSLSEQQVELRAALGRAIEENAALREALLRHASDRSEYAIEQVILNRDDVYLVVSKPAGPSVRLGRKFTVVDRTDGALLGVFAVSDVKKGAYYVKQVGRVDAVWGGYLRTRPDLVEELGRRRMPWRS